ncbi:glycosyltransferase family A protein [Collinsella sp. An2]|uniref:glycosyltransferase family 2 protein n=1 Tax=Collinsella sp. An2 TaxID=1965585 RepID=UPI000B380BCC|nr:glycosyltransferase family A protein [Collinsella sp. An2]OUP10068.1 hypothetical protein B5F33_03145 [Collinsella sp. An2]
MPKISVISPVYNAAPYVEVCVQSCLNQTLEDIELVFVDDGSTDDSLAVLQGIAARDVRLHILSQENAGASAARNNGLRHATGDFVFFIDADDYIPERTALERLYRSATEHGVAIAGGSMCIDRDGRISFDSMHGKELDSFEREEVVKYEDYQYDYDFTRYIYSLELIRKEGIFFPDRTQFEDPLFFVRIMLAAGRFATIPDAVYAYRYGHQKRTWSERAVLDRLRGSIELLDLSRELGYAKLHTYVMHQLDVEISVPLMGHVSNARVMSMLYRANSAIDCKLVQQCESNFPDVYVIEPLRWINDGYIKYLPFSRIVHNRYTQAVKRLVLKLLGR